MSADTVSIDAIIRAMYESVSGPAGLDRDTLRERSLFMPGAHLVRVTLTDDGKPQAKMMDVDTYLKDTAAFFRENDFYEVEIARRTEVFGQIAQVFSTYEARHALDDAAPFKRGINSIQLFNDGNRWWIVNMLWDNERDGNPMPVEYLP